MRLLEGIVVGLTLVAAGPAPAQEGWAAPVAVVGSGGEVCAAASDGEQSGLACLAVGCLAAGPLAVHLYLPGVPTPDLFEATIRVDADPKAALAFETVRDPENHRAVLTADDMALLDGLAAGERVEVTAVLGDRVVQHQFTLTGSRAAVAAARASCPMQDASVPRVGAAEVMAASPAALDGEDGFSEEEAALAPVSRAHSTIAEQCAMQGQEATVEPDFARRMDLDGDGIEDLVVDWGGVTCPSSGYCSADGCQHEVWLGRVSGEGYDLLLAENLAEVTAQAQSRLILRRTGDACGQAGSEPCATTVAIEGRALVPID